MFGGGFKATKLKPQLKMAVHRFALSSNKKTVQIQNQKRDIVKLLNEHPNPREEKAKIRAEALIREDHTVEAYEILQLSCELLAERIKLIASEKECPPDMVSVISTVIWASSRVDIPELIEIKKQFKSKYGKEFIENAMSNKGGVVNERVFAKLSIQPPPALLVQTYLEKIAEEFDVDWKPRVPLLPEEMGAPMKAPTGDTVPSAPATGYNTNTGSAYNNGIYPGIESIPSAPKRKDDLPAVNANTGLPSATPFPEPEIYVAPLWKKKTTNNNNSSESNDNISEVTGTVADYDISLKENNNCENDGEFSIPSAPPHRGMPRKKDDDNDDNDDDFSTTYRDLQKRFESLNE